VAGAGPIAQVDSGYAVQSAGVVRLAVAFVLVAQRTANNVCTLRRVTGDGVAHHRNVLPYDSERSWVS
jgi:hypothetical protein